MRPGYGVLFVVVFVACGPVGGSSTSVTSSRPNSSSSATTAVPAPESPTGSTTAAPSGVVTQPVTTSSTADVSNEILVIVEAGAVVSDRRAEVTVGDEVTIVVRTDVSDEAHLHGYDLFSDVQPGEDVTFTFIADIPGIFEMELEILRLQVLQLVVGQ